MNNHHHNIPHDRHKLSLKMLVMGMLMKYFLNTEPISWCMTGILTSRESQEGQNEWSHKDRHLRTKETQEKQEEKGKAEKEIGIREAWKKEKEKWKGKQQGRG